MALSPWSAYLQNEANKIFDHPRGRDIMLAMIDARRWESPEYERDKKQIGIDKARAAVEAPTAAGYWVRVAMRALIMLDMSAEEREQLIADTQLARDDARRELGENLAKGPPDPGEERPKKRGASDPELAALLASIKL